MNDKHQGPHCAGSCEGAAYQIEIRKLRHDIERLEAERDDHEQARTALEEMVGQLKAENEALRDAARAFYDATQAGGAGTNGILIGQDAVSRLNRTADALEKALAAHDKEGK